MEEFVEIIQDIYDKIKRSEERNFDESWRSGNDYCHGYGQACLDISDELKIRILDKFNKNKKEEKK